MTTHFFTLTLALFMTLAGGRTESVVQLNDIANENNQPVKTIVINSDDQMKFDKTELRVKAGEKIKLTLNHTGNLPVNAMGHNFVLLEAGTNIAAFGQEAMNAKANDYIPAKGVIAHTRLIGGGESTTVEFNAPKKGTYDFICSFPGHYAIMKGKFIVE